MFKEEIYETLLASDDEFAYWHGYTYSGHPTACAAALANLDIIERERLVQKARQQGDYLLRRLRALLDSPIVGEVRGQGLVAAVGLVRDKESREPFPADMNVPRRLWSSALERGLLSRPTADGVAVCPPLIITRSEIDRLSDILRDAIAEVADQIAA
jgi:L-2,4-diaminobutyrate transaminase